MDRQRGVARALPPLHVSLDFLTGSRAFAGPEAISVVCKQATTTFASRSCSVSRRKCRSRILRRKPIACLGGRRSGELCRDGGAFGSIRGRVGYAVGDWLLMQPAASPDLQRPSPGRSWPGTPAGGTAVGDGRIAAVMRPLSGLDGWRGRRCIAVESGARALNFCSPSSVSAAHFSGRRATVRSDLTTQTVRLGFNSSARRRWDEADILATGLPALEMDRFSLHAQTTYPINTPSISRAVRALPVSFPTRRETSDVTFYAGARLWQGAEFWVNPRSIRFRA